MYTSFQSVLQLLFQASAVLGQGHANAIVIAGQGVCRAYRTDTNHQTQYRHEVDDAVEGAVLASATSVRGIGQEHA